MDKLTRRTYHIGGMSCGGCAATVKRKLSAIPGVESVVVDLGTETCED